MPPADAVTDERPRRRGGRPKVWDTAVLVRTLTPRLAAVDAAAKDAGLSRNEWINRALAVALVDRRVQASIRKGTHTP